MDGADGRDGSPDTAGQVLDKLRQVDGAGSDLNADLFDGLESSALQRRGTSTSCPAGQVARVIEADGDVVCTPDRDTQYSAGTGLSMSGTRFSVTKAPDADLLDGTDSSGFVRAHEPAAFRSAHGTTAAGSTNWLLSLTGFGGVLFLCSWDGSHLWLQFKNTSGAPIAVLADDGASAPATRSWRTREHRGVGRVDRERDLPRGCRRRHVASCRDDLGGRRRRGHVRRAGPRDRPQAVDREHPAAPRGRQHGRGWTSLADVVLTFCM